MTYKGQVKGGIIVLEDPRCIREGAMVEVTVAAEKKTVGQRLMKYAGVGRGLPSDLAEEHNHYLHGLPKK